MLLTRRKKTSRGKAGVTLIEFVIALILLSFFVFVVYSIQTFSDQQLVASSRKTILINELSYALEHMSKNSLQTVGDGQTYPVYFDAYGSPPYSGMYIWVDRNGDGILQGGDKPAASRDRLTFYTLNDATGHGNYSLCYCPDATIITWPSHINCNYNCEQLGRHIISHFNSSYITINNNQNYFTVNMTACWDPDGSPHPCGSVKNPSVSMSTRVFMPSVPVN